MLIRRLFQNLIEFDFPSIVQYILTLLGLIRRAHLPIYFTCRYIIHYHIHSMHIYIILVIKVEGIMSHNLLIYHIMADVIG